MTALPVATDQLLVRFNFQPTFATQGFTGLQFPVDMGYGLTSRWALFLDANQGAGSLTEMTPHGPLHLNSLGSGDLLFFARYTLFKIDKPKSTFRIAPLVGGFMPTGSNTLTSNQALLPKALQTGSGSYDPYVGVTMGYNNSLWGMAWDTTYRKNPVAAQGISPGDELRSDAQVEIRVLPVHLPEEGLPKLLVLSVESNYVQDSRDRVNDIFAVDSGGKILKQDVTLEWTTLRWQLGVGGQVPIMQDLPGVGRMKERSAAFVYLEYYLAAPHWRHRKDP